VRHVLRRLLEARIIDVSIAKPAELRYGHSLRLMNRGVARSERLSFQAYFVLYPANGSFICTPGFDQIMKGCGLRIETYVHDLGAKPITAVRMLFNLALSCITDYNYYGMD
jgi:hypothetical protein